MAGPIPGGLGPQSPLKFVIAEPLVADSFVPPFIPFDDSRPKLLRALLLAPALWCNSGDLLLNTLAPNPVLREPVTTHQPQRAPRVRDEPQLNLVINVAAPVAAQPFQNIDWRLPAKPWDAASPATWFNSVIMPEGPKPFFGNESLPAPKQLRKQAESFPNWLVLQSQQAAPLPFFPQDWTQRKVQPSRAVEASQSLLQTTLAPQATPPFFGYAEQAPSLPRRTEQSWTQNLLESTLFAQAPPFLGTTTESAPLRKWADRSWSQNLIESTLGLIPTIAPFAQYDWPIPQGIRAPEVRIAEPQGWHITEVPPDPPIPPVPPVADSSSTPGKILSGRTLLRPEFKVESEQDKRDRRAREALEDAPQAKTQKQPDLFAYYKQSARIGKAISDARAEAEALKPRIAELEAKASKAQMQAKAKLEKQLLLAQQQLTLISVQEAVLMEEQEAIDIAFIALIAYLTATS